MTEAGRAVIIRAIPSLANVAYFSIDCKCERGQRCPLAGIETEILFFFYWQLILVVGGAKPGNHCSELTQVEI